MAVSWTFTDNSTYITVVRTAGGTVDTFDCNKQLIKVNFIEPEVFFIHSFPDDLNYHEFIVDYALVTSPVSVSASDLSSQLQVYINSFVGAGAGITTLNTLNAAIQTFSKVDDTNMSLTLTPLVANHQFALAWVGTLADARIASSGAWNAKQDAINLTTIGTSGAATFIANTLNIPDYTSTAFITSVSNTDSIHLTETLGDLTADLQIQSTATISLSINASGLSADLFSIKLSSYDNDVPFLVAADLAGYVPNSRTLTINGSAQDLSVDRTWSVGTVTSVASADGSITVTNPTTTVDLAVVKSPILTTARTIGGVSFNGSANIVPQTIESVNEATDTTCFPLFITASGTQQLQPKNNTGFTYNSNTNSLAATTFVGALTGNATTATNVAVGGITGLGTGVATALAVNVGTAGSFVVNGGALGTPSSGTLTNATGLPSILIANEATDTTCFVNFTTGTTGELGIKSNANLTFNSNTASLACTTFVGALTGNATGNVSGTAATFTGNLTGDVTSVAMVTILATAQPAVHTWALTQTFTVAPVISAMTLGSVLFAGTSGIVSQDNALFFWDDTNNTLYSGGNSGAFTATPMHATGTTNSYLQNNIRNLSNGNSASSDFIATADNGTDSTFYVDFGINSSTYNNASYTITGINDAYLYSQSSNLTLGTATAAKSVLLHTGGTLAANERMRVTDTENYSAVIDSQTTTPTGNVTVQASFSTVVGGKTYTLASGKTLTLSSGASITLV